MTGRSACSSAIGLFRRRRSHHERPLTIPSPAKFAGARENAGGPPPTQGRDGGRLTWPFVDRTPHNLLYANGPRVVGSPTLSRGRSYFTHFLVPGHYEQFCYLHPMTMHQVIEVQPR
jgi:hypothetical protein